MSKCNKCPYNYYDYEENCNDCSIYDYPLILWNENKCRCRIPLFLLRIMHKRQIKAELKYWGDLYKSKGGKE